MTELTRSPLAPANFPDLRPVAGVRLAAAEANIRYRRTDVMLVELDAGTTVAGVLTKSQTAAAPVDWCRALLPNGVARALIVNSGNANAFTGYAGVRAVATATAAVGQAIGCRAEEIYVASTGVIGEEMPVDRLIDVVPDLKATLSPGNWQAAAEAIRTTDTYAKGAGTTFQLDGKPYVLNGIAKGSGMIAPDMATMLGFLFTDATLPAPILQACLVRANQTSFNAITVDSDTSTSDTVLLFATGATELSGGAKHGPIEHGPIENASDSRLRGFKKALGTVMTDLAHQIVRDGEGASKFVAVTVTGAASKKAARRIALSVAESPLVKTAIAGEDPNWGRIVMAVGKAGERADRDKLSIKFGSVVVAEQGVVAPGYVEADAAEHMKRNEIEITIDVGVGRSRFTVWTCDLTAEYIRINADYRT